MAEQITHYPIFEPRQQQWDYGLSFEMRVMQKLAGIEDRLSRIEDAIQKAEPNANGL